MGKGLNKVQLIGRLGATPEMRYTPQGHAVTTFRIAVNRGWKDTRGEQQTETDWFRVIVWNTLAEHCNQFLDTGRLVYVEGRLQIRKWQDQNGQTRAVVEILAHDVIFLDSRSDSERVADDIEAAHGAGRKPQGSRPAVARSRAHAHQAESSSGADQSTRQRRKRAGRTASTTTRPSDEGRAKGAFEEEDLPF